MMTCHILRKLSITTSSSQLALIRNVKHPHLVVVMTSTETPISGTEEQTGVQSITTKVEEDEHVAPIVLPEIPTADLSFDFSSVIGSPSPEQEKIQKRASNVMKLAQENEKLKAELKAMTDRLEAAERRREKLSKKEQKIMEERSS